MGHYGAETQQPIPDWQLTASAFCVQGTWCSLDPNDLCVTTSQRNQRKRPGVLLCGHQAWEGLVSSAHGSPLRLVLLYGWSGSGNPLPCLPPAVALLPFSLGNDFCSASISLLVRNSELHLVNSNGQIQSAPGLTSDPFSLRCSVTCFLRYLMNSFFLYFLAVGY